MGIARLCLIHMTAHLFSQTTIAVIWDFDKTLIPGYMQEPLFARYEVDPNLFWREVNALPDFYRKSGLEIVSPDTLYLNHILTYVRGGIFEGLDNVQLRKFGAELTFYEGLPEFFPRLKQIVEQHDVFSKHEIAVEHYVVSTGLRQIILGSAIAEHLEEVWACEFVEQVAPPGFLDGTQQELLESPSLRDIGYVIDNTTKTRAVFEINKGANKHPQINVNSRMAEEDRRIPFQNMIYLADGPSDVPVFSILNRYGGKTYAVYRPGVRAEFMQVRGLSEEGRVDGYGEADYRQGTHTEMWITTSVEQIASRIVQERELALRGAVGRAPRHILEDPEPTRAAGHPAAGSSSPSPTTAED